MQRSSVCTELLSSTSVDSFLLLDRRLRHGIQLLESERLNKLLERIRTSLAFNASADSHHLRKLHAGDSFANCIPLVLGNRLLKVKLSLLQLSDGAGFLDGNLLSLSLSDLLLSFQLDSLEHFLFGLLLDLSDGQCLLSFNLSDFLLALDLDYGLFLFKLRDLNLLRSGNLGHLLLSLSAD